MQTRRNPPPGNLTRGSQGIASFFVLFLAVGFLIYQLFSAVLFTFSDSPGAGIRSLAAALLPLLILVYLGFIARLQLPVRESRSPVINNFIVFLLWTILVLGIDASVDLSNVPVEELLYSCTLAAMLWRFRYRDSLKSLIACSYGVLAGALAAVIIFGIDTIVM